MLSVNPWEMPDARLPPLAPGAFGAGRRGGRAACGAVGIDSDFGRGRRDSSSPMVPGVQSPAARGFSILMRVSGDLRLETRKGPTASARSLLPSSSSPAPRLSVVGRPSLERRGAPHRSWAIAIGARARTPQAPELGSEPSPADAPAEVVVATSAASDPPGDGVAGAGDGGTGDATDLAAL